MAKQTARRAQAAQQAGPQQQLAAFEAQIRQALGPVSQRYSWEECLEEVLRRVKEYPDLEKAWIKLQAESARFQKEARPYLPVDSHFESWQAHRFIGARILGRILAAFEGLLMFLIHHPLLSMAVTALATVGVIILVSGVGLNAIEGWVVRHYRLTEPGQLGRLFVNGVFVVSGLIVVAWYLGATTRPSVMRLNNRVARAENRLVQKLMASWRAHQAQKQRLEVARQRRKAEEERQRRQQAANPATPATSANSEPAE